MCLIVFVAFTLCQGRRKEKGGKQRKGRGGDRRAGKGRKEKIKRHVVKR